MISVILRKQGGLLPATPAGVAAYLQAFASQLNPRTLARRLIALRHWHTYQGIADPTQHPTINKILKGIKNVHGKPLKQASALLVEDLQHIIQWLETQSTLSACRDRALFMIGFFGSFRRSELARIKVEDVRWVKEGIDILIPQSKTDPTHEGQSCSIPYGASNFCPVLALKSWLTMANIKSGYIFRALNKVGGFSHQTLSSQSINQILVRRARAAGLTRELQWSSHSLRRGFTTSALRDGAPIPSVQRQNRWKNVNSVMRYAEEVERFKENAGQAIFSKLK